MRPDVRSRLSRAFPARVDGDLQDVLASLPDSRYDPVGTVGPVRLGGETLDIPHRVYLPELTDVGGFDGNRRALFACIYSRHHDGFVREKYVRDLLASPEPWVAPFVVQLVGEYVVEILNVLAAHLAQLKTTPYREFVAENPSFLLLTRQRMISYWDCYYRQLSPQIVDYVGTSLIDALSGPKPSTIGAAKGPSNNKRQRTKHG